MEERGAVTPPPTALPVVDGAVLCEAGIQPPFRAAGAQPPVPGMGRVGARGEAPTAVERATIRERRNHGRRRFRDCDVKLRRFGDNLSVQSSRHYRSPDYEPDYDVSHMDSFDHSMSSSDKENVVPRRKRMLDDALFDFFSKEAVKSLKNNFSNFCHDSDIWTKNKKFKSHDIGRDQFVSYSIKYFGDVLSCLTVRRKEVIRNFGFACLLMFEKCEVPSAFTRWLVSRVDHVSSQIIIDDCKVIPISKDFLHDVIGLPNRGSVPMPDSDAGAKLIMSMFGLTKLPHITFFGNKLKSK